MSKDKPQKLALIETVEGEEGFVIQPVKFYAERTQILTKTSPEDTTEYYLTLHTDNPEVLKIGKDSAIMYEVTIKPAE